MSFFIKLLETTDASRCELEGLPKIQDMLNGKMSQEEYKTFLMNFYHIVLNLCPIMAAAASRCTEQFAEVRYHLYQKIDKEKGHEKIILNDLQVFGISENVVKSTPPLYPIQILIAYNYYACERIHPCCVIGMLYASELIFSVYCTQLATSISLGLHMSQPEGFLFLDSHSAMKLDHVAELGELLRKINDKAIQETIINAIQINFYLFINFFKS